MGNLLIGLFSSGMVILAVAIPIVVSVWMLLQLDRAARLRRVAFQNANLPKPPARIMIMDGFSLIFLLQIPFALIINSEERRPFDGLIVLIVFALVALGAIWWTTIRTVSEAGISSFRWRAIISMIVIPSAYIGCFFVPVGVINLLNSGGSGYLWFLTILACSGMVLSPFLIVCALKSVDKNIQPEHEGYREIENTLNE